MINRHATITIVETLERPGKGNIVCGTDADLLDWTTDQIRGLAAGEAIVQGEHVLVLSVKVSAAMSGRRNIFLLLPETTPVALLAPGTPMQVFARN